MFHILSGLLCDLLWSNPDKDTSGWGENYGDDDPDDPHFGFGSGFTFGADVVSKFLNRHNLDLICRGHQVILTSLTNGYK